MRSIPIEGHTRRLGAPANWDHAESGICHTLEIIDQDGWMTSAWMPSPKELQRMIYGYPILLHIQGTMHPVVGLSIAGE